MGSEGRGDGERGEGNGGGGRDRLKAGPACQGGPDADQAAMIGAEPGDGVEELEDLAGVGSATAEKLRRAGISTVRDLAAFSARELEGLSELSDGKAGGGLQGGQGRRSSRRSSPPGSIWRGGGRCRG